MSAEEFRNKHLSQLLKEFDDTYSADRYIASYFKYHSSLGSKDRAYISEIFFQLVRRKLLLDFLLERKKIELSWENRFNLLQSIDIKRYFFDESIPSHIRFSVTESFFSLLSESFGMEKALEIGSCLNSLAPLTVRVNTLKISRSDLIEIWKKRDILVSPCNESSVGIHFKKRVNFFTLPEFKLGYFEVQDEASQLVAQLVQAKPGDQILDYCAGSGGKSLAFAEKLQARGQIFLHDIREKVLYEAKKRLKRAGIENAQVVFPSQEKKLKQLKKKMDWVFVDVPCSGSGTFRRNPDMKFKCDRSMIERLIGEQRNIFEKALSFLKPDGKIIYATCSLLSQENQDQVSHFLKTYQLELDCEQFQSIPIDGGKDGFFAAVLKRKDAVSQKSS